MPEQVHCRNCPTYRQAGRELLNRPMPGGYRAELTQRLAVPPEAAANGELRLLVFRVASVWLALPSACFEATLAPVPVVPVPLRSNRHFLGLVNIRGELQLCFTLEHLLGPDPDEPVAPSGSVQVFPRLLLVNLRSQRWAFPVDEVLGTLEPSRTALDNPPPNLARPGQQLVAALFRAEGLRIKLLDGERLAALFQEALA